MFRRLALKAILTAGLTTTLAAAADQTTPIYELSPPFAIFFFSSNGSEFCDFFLITQNGLLAGGIHSFSTTCGGFDALVAGSFGLSFGIPPFGSIPANSYNLNSTVNVPSSLFYLLNQQNRTWANYGWDGTSLSMINSGRFVIGVRVSRNVRQPVKTLVTVRW